MDQRFKSLKEPVHGGNLAAFCRRTRRREDEVVDFSSNVNPLGVPDSVRGLYPKLLDELSRYPDPASREFCEEIAKHFSVAPENIIAGNGAISLLAVAIRALAPRRALVIEPSFTEYRHLLELQGAEVQSFFLKEHEDFLFSLPEILGRLSGVDLILLGHPNNPTGTAFEPNELRQLLSEALRRNVFVIIDEAFVDWCPEISMAEEAKRAPHLIILRSLTKFFALAGIRSGFALGAKNWIQAMKGHQEAWSCNRLAQRLSIAALQDKAFQERSREWFGKESRRFFEILKSVPGFKVYPSLANFFLIQLKDRKASCGLFEFLEGRGLCVRPASDFNGLNDSYFRIALRLQEENDSLSQGLRDWTRERNQKLQEAF